MPRKPEPSFSLKFIIWDIAATVGMDNFAAVYRELDRRLEELREEDKLFEDTPDQRKVRDIIELDIQRLTPEVVVAKLPRHVWHLRNDYEDIKQLAEESIEAEREAPKGAETNQKPYEETPHTQKMREMARELATIRLPSVMDSFRVWGEEYHAERYSELCNDDVFFVIEIDNRQIAAYADLEGLESTDHETAEENYAWKMLFTHLDTGGFSGLIDKVRNFKPEMEAYFRCCYAFLKLVEKRIECEYGLSVPSSYSEKYGLTHFFTISVAIDAIQTYDGLSSIEDSSYRIEEEGNDWVLTCEGRGIFICDTEGKVNNYEKMHKDLRLEWASRDKREQVEALTEMRKDLEDTVKKVRKDLLTFVGKDTLPGHCELC